MVTPAQMSSLADDLRSAARGMDRGATALTTATRTAGDTVDDLPTHWGGPLADRVVGTASDYLGQVDGAGHQMRATANALRSLAGEADGIAGALTTLRNARDDLPPTATEEERTEHRSGLDGRIARQEEAWQSACDRFDQVVAEPIAALETIARCALTSADLEIPQSYEARAAQALRLLPEGSGDDVLDALWALDPAAAEAFWKDIAESEDPAFVQAVLAIVGADGLTELALTYAEGQDHGAIEAMADVVFGAGLEGEELDGFLTQVDGATVLLLAVAGDPPPSAEIVQTALFAGVHVTHPGVEDAIAHFLDQRGHPIWEGDAYTPLDTQVAAVVLTGMLAQPGGWHAVDEVLMAGNNLTTLQDRPELAALVTGFLIENPAALDGAFALADQADVDSAVGLANLVRFLESGGQVDGVVTAYAAHRVDAAFTGSGDVLYELTQAGEAIARVQMAAGDLGEGTSIDVGGLAVDSALVGLEQLPIVGVVIEGGGVVVGNVTFPAPTDFEAGTVQNREDFAVAVDLLTAGHPGREAILQDLGMVDEDGALQVPEGSLRDLAEANPEYVPLIQYADALADGMAITPGQTGG